MVEVRPFQGFVFDPSRTGTPDAVLTPPYDVIEPAQRAILAASGTYNMTHVMLPVAEGDLSPYDHAAAVLNTWMAEGALKQDETPSIYLLRQRFRSFDGQPLERKAFFALLRLPDSGEQFILGHEHTFDSPIEDRLALMRATAGNLEPIFVMYPDPGLTVSNALFAPLDESAPFLAATTIDGVTQELWRSPCPEVLMQHLQDKILYIADGHHRFKTACLYRDQSRASEKANVMNRNYEYIMTAFVAFEEPGLKIYPAHRVVPASITPPFEALRAQLLPYFSMEPLPPGEVHAARLDRESGRCQMIVYTRDTGGWLLTLDESRRDALLDSERNAAWCALDVAVLHRGILDRLLGIKDSSLLQYEKEDREAVSLVNTGAGGLAFLVRPTRPEQVRACAEAFEPMPQKSTYFFPKMPSGAVMNFFNR